MIVPGKVIGGPIVLVQTIFPGAYPYISLTIFKNIEDVITTYTLRIFRIIRIMSELFGFPVVKIKTTIPGPYPHTATTVKSNREDFITGYTIYVPRLMSQICQGASPTVIIAKSGSVATNPDVAFFVFRKGSYIFTLYDVWIKSVIVFVIDIDAPKTSGYPHSIVPIKQNIGSDIVTQATF